MTRRLQRSTSERMFAGVSGGIAEYLEVDPVLVRAIWVVLAFATAGTALIAYIVLWVLMPEADERSTTFTGAADSTGETDTQLAQPSEETSDRGSGRTSDEVHSRRLQTVGIVLVVMGILFLAGNLGLFDWLEWNVIWPTVLILLGVMMLVRRSRRQ
ncbi:MAG: PspC domain-containing protein [Dehalococcoidia bacterium]